MAEWLSSARMSAKCALVNSTGGRGVLVFRGHQTDGHSLAISSAICRVLPANWPVRFSFGFKGLTFQLPDISETAQEDPASLLAMLPAAPEPGPRLPRGGSHPRPPGTHLMGSWSSLSSLLCAIRMPLFLALGQPERLEKRHGFREHLSLPVLAGFLRQ